MSQKKEEGATAVLPRFVIIQSYGFTMKHLHLDKDNPSVAGALRFNGDYSYGLETRFEVEPSTKGDGLVHIRSVLNNKYWEAKRTPEKTWITATAEKPVEDADHLGCTLFLVSYSLFYESSPFDCFRIFHKNTGYQLVMDNLDAIHACLKLTTESDDVHNGVFGTVTLIDWESVVMLPERIWIKGDNGKYLKAKPDGYMEYSGDSEVNSELEYEVSASANGGIRLKSLKYGKYWKKDENSSWILAKDIIEIKPIGDQTWSLAKYVDWPHPENTIFKAMKRADNTILLRSFVDGLFCTRDTTSNRLAAFSNYLDKGSVMTIEEPLFSRTIDNVIYHVTDARMYDEHVVALQTQKAVNEKENPDTIKLNFSRKDNKKKQWTTGTTITSDIKFGLTATVEVVEASAGASFGMSDNAAQTGGEDEEPAEVGCVYTVTVPPKSGVKVTLMASKASYDVPFSYTQRDVLRNGRIIVYRKNDGLFHGQNAFNYKCVSVPLDFE